MTFDLMAILLLQINNPRVQLYFVAAMESLDRESQLLDPTQRQLISTMLKDHSDKVSPLQSAKILQQQPPSASNRTRHGSDGSSERSIQQVPIDSGLVSICLFFNVTKSHSTT